MKKFICTVCGYVYEGDEAPEFCPQCKQPRSKFKEVVESDELDFVTEHHIGDGVVEDAEVMEGLKAHFMGECTEVGMYLAMSRQADREGYPEVAEAFKRYAWEEAEHASKFAELLGEIVWNTEKNLKARMEAESGACADKMRIAKRAKELGYDAIHDTVHEMAKDEARHVWFLQQKRSRCNGLIFINRNQFRCAMQQKAPVTGGFFVVSAGCLEASYKRFDVVCRDVL